MSDIVTDPGIASELLKFLTAQLKESRDGLQMLKQVRFCLPGLSTLVCYVYAMFYFVKAISNVCEWYCKCRYVPCSWVTSSLPVMGDIACRVVLAVGLGGPT